MKHTLAVVAAAVVALGFGSAIGAESGPHGTMLNSEAYHSLFDKGAIIEVRNPSNGFDSSVVFTAGGVAYTAFLGLAGGTGGQDMGTWKIKGDTLCLKWRQIYDRQEYCTRYYKVGDNAYESWRLDGSFGGAFGWRR